MTENEPPAADRAPEESAFAERVKGLREELGWSQSDLAERMRLLGLDYVSQSTISRIEKQTRPIHLGEALAFGRVFGRSIEELTHPSFGVAMLRVHRQHAEFLASTIEAFETSAVVASLAKLEADNLRQMVDDAENVDRSNPEVARNTQAAHSALDLVQEADLTEAVGNAASEARRMFSRGSRIRLSGDKVEIYQNEPF